MPYARDMTVPWRQRRFAAPEMIQLMSPRSLASLSSSAGAAALLPVSPCDLGLPRRDLALDDADQAVEADRHDHQHHDRHEHGGGVEIIGRVDDDGAEARNGGEELGDHHGDHRTADRKA